MLENSFLYKVDINYDRHYSCDENGCDKEGICRCCKIINQCVTNVDIQLLSEHIFNMLIDTNTSQGKRDAYISDILYGGKSIDIYCIDRILRHYKVYDPKSWDIEIYDWYYGEEIKEVSIKEDIFIKVMNDISNIMSMGNISDKIRYILTLEYGYLLDFLKEGEFNLIKINKSNIDFSLSSYKQIKNVFLKIVNHKIDYYDSRYILPRGIVLKVGDKFKIIDGYHRINSASSLEDFYVYYL